MKGLLRKEYYCLRLQFLFYLALALLMWGVTAFTGKLGGGMWFAAIYPSFLFGLLPMSSLSQDVNDRWDVYSAALPCSRRTLVNVKFLTLLLSAGCCVLLMALVYGLGYCFHRRSYSALLLPFLLASLFFLLVVPAIDLALAFRFGPKRANGISVLISAGLLGAASVLLSGSSFPAFSLGSTVLGAHVDPALLIFLCLLILSALAVFLCWQLSVRAYEKRDL